MVCARKNRDIPENKRLVSVSQASFAFVYCKAAVSKTRKAKFIIPPISAKKLEAAVCKMAIARAVYIS